MASFFPGVSRLRKTALATVAVGSLMGVTACGSTPSATAPVSAAPKPTVTIGYLLTPDPEAVAAQLKFFSRTMNANVQFKSFDSGPASLAALASGAIQFMTVIGNPPVVNAIAKGIPVKVIWAQEQYTTGEGLIVKAGSGIHSLSGIEGHTVALVVGSTSDLAFSTALKEAHIPKTSVKILDMSPPDMVAAWKAGNIDAAYTWDPAKSAMLNDGGRMLIYDQNQSAPIWNLAVVNKDWAATHKSLVEGFIKAEAEGVSYYHAHASQSYAAMAQWNGISSASAKQQASGFKFISLTGQLTAAGMGVPGQVGQSMVAKGLAMAAQQSLAEGLAKSMPSSFVPYIDESYVQAVIHTSKGA